MSEGDHKKGNAVYRFTKLYIVLVCLCFPVFIVHAYAAVHSEVIMTTHSINLKKQYMHLLEIFYSF